MQTIKIETKKLLNKIRENRKNHIAQYLEAINGYAETAKEKLKESLDLLSSTGKVKMPYLTEPVSHESDYDSMIQKLDMTSDKIVELTHSEFETYVMDRWAWKNNFDTTNSMYNSKKMAK